MSHQKYTLTWLQEKLAIALPFLFILMIVGLMFMRGDATWAPDPPSGRTHPITLYSRGGVATAYVDEAGLIFFRLFVWPVFIAVGLLFALILFEKARIRWREKNEGQRHP